MTSYLDHFDKARGKVEKYQWTSDIGSDGINENIIGKRTITKPKRYKITSSESSDEELTTHATTSKKLPPRPPTIVKNTKVVSAQEPVKRVEPLSPLQTHLRQTSTPVSLTQEVAINTEAEIDNGNILLLHN